MLQHRPQYPSDGGNIAAGTHEPVVGSSASMPSLPAVTTRLMPAWIARSRLISAIPLVLILGLGAEAFAPEDFKPSTMMGGFFGHADAVRMRTELTASQAKLATQNEENARLQKQVEDFRARTERVTEGYKTLYARTTIMAQAMAQIQQEYLATRSRMVQDTQGGNVAMANLSQIVAGLGLALGDKEMAEKGLEASHAFTNEAVSNADQQFQKGVATSAAEIQNWQQGLPDMQEVDRILKGDAGGPLPPADHAPPPPPPAMYRTPPMAQQ